MSFLPIPTWWSRPSPIIEAHLRTQMTVEDQQRLLRYERAWKVYYGTGTKPLKVGPNLPDDNVISNKARTIADKSAAYLFGREITFQITRASDTDGQSPDETWLAECWAANGYRVLLLKTAINGAVCGTPFLLLQAPEAREGFPRVIVLDPAHVSVVTAPDDVDRVERYTVAWAAIDPTTGKPITYRKLIDPAGAGWQIVEQRSEPDNSTWETTATLPWPYPFPPIAHCQNLPNPNEFWGLADLNPDLLDLAHQRNFTLSNMLRIIRHHAHPKTWGKAFDAKQLPTDPTAVIVLESDDAELHNLEMQSDLASSLEFDRRLDEAAHELSRVPPIATGRMDNMDALSGVALQLRFQPLLELTETKRLTYGAMLEDVSTRLLVLSGRLPAPVTILWFELLPTDPVQQRQIAIADHDLGASRETLLDRLGYDAKAELAKRAQEDAADAELAMKQQESELAAKMRLSPLSLPPPDTRPNGARS